MTTPNTINFDLLASEWEYAAMDYDGRWCVYTKKPVPNDDDGRFHCAQGSNKFRRVDKLLNGVTFPAVSDWKRSIITRDPVEAYAGWVGKLCFFGYINDNTDDDLIGILESVESVSNGKVVFRCICRKDYTQYCRPLDADDVRDYIMQS